MSSPCRVYEARRRGDFYEIYGEGAIDVSKALGLTLQSRNDAPMCGIPFHQLERWDGELRAAGIELTPIEVPEVPK